MKNKALFSLVVLFVGIFGLMALIQTSSAQGGEAGWITCVHNGNSVTVNYGFSNAIEIVHIVRKGSYFNNQRKMDEEDQKTVATIGAWLIPYSSSGSIVDDKVFNYGHWGSFRIEPERQYTYYLWRGNTSCPPNKILAETQCSYGRQSSDPEKEKPKAASCNSVCMEKWGCPGECRWKGVGCLMDCPAGMRDPQTTLSVCSRIFPCERCCCNCPASSAEITCRAKNQSAIDLSIKVRGGYDDFYLYRDGVQLSKLSRRQHGDYETVSFSDTNLKQGQSYVYQVKSSASGWPNIGSPATCQTLAALPTSFVIEPSCGQRGSDFVVINYRYINPPGTTLYLGSVQEPRLMRVIPLSSNERQMGVWHQGSVRVDSRGIAAGRPRLDWQFYDCACPNIRRAVSGSVECSFAGAAPPTPVPPDSAASNISLSPGWNMVSWPASGSLSFSTISSHCANSVIWGWSRSANSYYKPESMVPGQGYWIGVDQPCRLPVTGSPWRGSVSLVGAGWHMVGAPAGGIGIDRITGDCQVSSIWGWSPSAREYVRPTRLEEGQGYWFRTAGSCTLGF